METKGSDISLLPSTGIAPDGILAAVAISQREILFRRVLIARSFALIDNEGGDQSTQRSHEKPEGEKRMTIRRAGSQ